MIDVRFRITAGDSCPACGQGLELARELSVVALREGTSHFVDYVEARITRELAEAMRAHVCPSEIKPAQASIEVA